MGLNRVMLDKRDTCLTYAFKRAGIKTSVEWAIDLDKEFDLVPYNSVKVKKGDVVLWNYTRHDVTVGWEIDEEGRVVQHEVTVGIHLGVVEDSKVTLVSDVTRKMGDSYLPQIRVRKLDEVRSPDYVLKRKRCLAR